MQESCLNVQTFQQKRMRERHHLLHRKVSELHERVGEVAGVVNPIQLVMSRDHRHQQRGGLNVQHGFGLYDTIKLL